MMKLVKCQRFKPSKNEKHDWQIRWEDKKGDYIFAIQFGRVKKEDAKKAYKEFKAWMKKWRGE